MLRRLGVGGVHTSIYWSGAPLTPCIILRMFAFTSSEADSSAGKLWAMMKIDKDGRMVSERCFENVISVASG